jgi:hypothetical protein
LHYRIPPCSCLKGALNIDLTTSKLKLNANAIEVTTVNEARLLKKAVTELALLRSALCHNVSIYLGISVFVVAVYKLDAS